MYTNVCRSFADLHTFVYIFCTFPPIVVHICLFFSVTICKYSNNFYLFYPLQNPCARVMCNIPPAMVHLCKLPALECSGFRLSARLARTCLPPGRAGPGGPGPGRVPSSRRTALPSIRVAQAWAPGRRPPQRRHRRPSPSATAAGRGSPRRPGRRCRGRRSGQGRLREAAGRPRPCRLEVRFGVSFVGFFKKKEKEFRDFCFSTMLFLFQNACLFF